MVKSTTSFNAFRISFSTIVAIEAQTEEQLVNYSPSCQLEDLSHHHSTPTGMDHAAHASGPGRAVFCP